jgi:hypothetical protein
VNWSIVAFDAEANAFGIAAATENFAVGATVPHLRAGVDAVATQSISNRCRRPAVLDAMARGLSPKLAIAGAAASDEGLGGMVHRRKTGDAAAGLVQSPDGPAERAVAAGMERGAFATVPYAPLGQYRQPTAYWDTISDVLPAGAPVFWNLRKGRAGAHSARPGGPLPHSGGQPIPAVDPGRAESPMTKEELTAWALANGWRMIGGHPSLTKPGAPKDPIVRIVMKATVANLEVRKPAGKWEKVGGDSYAKVVADTEDGPPRGLGFEKVPSITMLMQENRDLMIFTKMGG